MKHSTWIIALLVGVVAGGGAVWLGVPLIHDTIQGHSVIVPTTEARQKVASLLPSYVSLTDLTLDGSNGSPYPFKGSVSPQEDLFSASTKEPDLGDAVKVPMTTTPPAPLIILTVVDKQGVPISIYGKVTADKEVDKWIVGDVSIDSGLDQLGKPRAGFPPEAIISGTPDGDKALAGFEAAIADYKQKAAAQLEEQMQAAQKIHAERDAQAASDKAKLLDLLKVGSKYKGTISVVGDNQTAPINLVVTGMTGSRVRVEASNPDMPSSNQSFTGNVSDNEKADPNFYPLVMGPEKPPQNLYQTTVWWFYLASGQLELRPANGGLEGSASMTCPFGTFQYTLELQRTTDPAGTSQ
jgi:hypothetical protein